MTQSSLGRVVVEGDHATLIFDRLLPHPIQTVWEAITDPNKLEKWYFPDVKVDPRGGGLVEYSSEEGRVTGRILEWEPPRVFEHEWIVERSGTKGEYGIIRWELEGTGPNTVLRLTHRRLSAKVAHGFAPGVHAILDLLAAYLDNAKLPNWSKLREELRTKYAQ